MKIFQENFIKYGLLMCCILILCLLAMQLTGQNTSFDNKSFFQIIFQFIAPIIVWFIGIRAKKKYMKKKMTYRQGLSEGFKISLVFASISPFIFMLYYLFINPTMLIYVRNVYGLSGTSNATLIAVDMLMQFFMSLVLGGFLSVILAFFLKTRKA